MNAVIKNIRQSVSVRLSISISTEVESDTLEAFVSLIL